MPDVLLPDKVLAPRQGLLLRLRGVMREPYEYGDRYYWISISKDHGVVRTMVKGTLSYAGRTGKELADLRDMDLVRYARAWGSFALIHYPRAISQINEALHAAFPARQHLRPGEDAWYHYPARDKDGMRTSYKAITTNTPFPEGLETLLQRLPLENVTGTYQEPTLELVPKH